jgi:hypothetical protein
MGPDHESDGLMLWAAIFDGILWLGRNHCTYQLQGLTLPVT